MKMNDKAEKGAMQVDVQLVRDLAALLAGNENERQG